MYGLQSSEYDKDDKVHNDFKDFKVSREKPALMRGKMNIHTTFTKHVQLNWGYLKVNSARR